MSDSSFNHKDHTRERRKFKTERQLSLLMQKINENKTVDQICEELSITRQTYYNWLHKLGDQEREFKQKTFEDNVVVQTKAIDDLFTESMQTLREIEKDKDTAAHDRIEALK